MTGHDPRAADTDFARTRGLLRDLLGNREMADLVAGRIAAAGLVVRPADDGYERVEWGWSDDCCVRPVIYGDWPDDPDHRPLYVRKENPAVDALLAAERASTEGDDRG